MSSGPDEPIRIRSEDLPPEDAASTPRSTAPSPRRDTLPYISLGLGILSILFAGVAIGPVAMICGLGALLRSRGGEESRSQLLAALGIATGLAGALLWGVLIWQWLGQPRHKPEETRDGSLPVSVGTLDAEAIEKSPPPIRRALLSSVSVVLERRTRSTWTAIAHGSGTVISRSGDRFFVLTCRHVVAGEGGPPEDRRLRLSWIGGEGEGSRIEWQAHPPFDLALLSVGVAPGQVAPQIARLGRAALLSIGDPLFAVGDPLSYRMSYASGALSAVRVLSEGKAPVKVFQTTVPLNPGNSGGGLYNAAGELVGVNSWILKGPGVEGIGFSLTVENLWSALEGAPAEIAEMIHRLVAVPGEATGPGSVEGSGASPPPAR